MTLGENGVADSLAKKAAAGEQSLMQPLHFEVLETPANEEIEVLSIDGCGHNMDDISPQIPNRG